MIGIRECVQKRCFFTTKDGKRGIKIHRSVILSEGSVIRFDAKNSTWKFSSLRLNSKVARSMTRTSMQIAQDAAREVKDEEQFSSYEKFACRLAAIIGIDALVQVTMFLGGR